MRKQLEHVHGEAVVAKVQPCSAHSESQYHQAIMATATLRASISLLLTTVYMPIQNSLDMMKIGMKHMAHVVL